MQMEQMPDYENDKDVLQKFGRNINEEVYLKVLRNVSSKMMCRPYLRIKLFMN